MLLRPATPIYVPGIGIAGSLVVTDNSSLTLVSPVGIDNTGTIELNSTGHATTLYIDQATATLDGSGHVTLSNDTHNVIAATTSGQQLTNLNNTISGAGTIGAGGMLLVNDSPGVIDANVSHSLTLDPTTLANSGLVEATVGGTLILNDTVVTNFISALNGDFLTDATSELDVQGSSIAGGTLHNSGKLVGTGTSALHGVGVTNSGTLESASSVLTIDGNSTVGNSGTLQAIDDSTLALTATTVTNTTNGSVKVASGSTLDLDSGAKIVGGTLINSGVVQVETSAGAILDGVTVSGSGTINVDLTALAASLILQGGTSIDGGTLAIGNAGILEIETALGALLKGGIAVTNGNLIQIDVSAVLKLYQATISGGTITDNGTIDVTGDSTIKGSASNLSGGGTGQIKIEAAKLTLDGVTVTGTSISETTTGSILSVDGSDTLTLAGTDSITGVSGSNITNAGTIDVTGTTTITTDSLTNTGAGTLKVDSTLKLSGATVSGGTITDNGIIDVTGDSTIKSVSNLNGGGTGQIKIEAAKLTLDSVTVTDTSISETTSGSILSVDASNTLTLAGTDSITGVLGSSISNAGTIDVTGTTTITTDSLHQHRRSTLKVDNTLKLSGATISGGTITDNGIIEVTGDSTINGSASSHQRRRHRPDQDRSRQADARRRHRDRHQHLRDRQRQHPVGGRQRHADPGGTDRSAASRGSSITNAGTIDVTGTTTMTNDSLTNTGRYAAGRQDTLKLNGATITGGTITDNGSIEVTGDSNINGQRPVIGGGTGEVKIEAAKLTLDGVTVTGTSISETTSGSILRSTTATP